MSPPLRPRACRSRASAAAIAMAIGFTGAAACGKYGPPVRPEESAGPAERGDARSGDADPDAADLDPEFFGDPTR